MSSSCFGCPDSVKFGKVYGKKIKNITRDHSNQILREIDSECSAILAKEVTIHKKIRKYCRRSSLSHRHHQDPPLQRFLLRKSDQKANEGITSSSSFCFNLNSKHR